MLTGILCLVGAQAFTLPSHPVARNAVVASSAAPVMFFGKKPAAQEPTVQNARDAREADFQRRQDRLAQRGAAAASQPKGQVEVTFPQKGNKVVKAMQGDPIGKVCQKAGVRVKFDCKNGRCGTCEVSINGRSKAKVCQGAKVPGGGDGRHFEPQIRGLRVLTPRLLCTPSHQKDLGQADQRVSSCSRQVRPGSRGNELQGSFEPALSTTGGPHTLHIHRDEHGRLGMSTRLPECVAGVGVKPHTRRILWSAVGLSSCKNYFRTNYFSQKRTGSRNFTRKRHHDALARTERCSRPGFVRTNTG